MLKGTLTAIFASHCENGGFYAQIGAPDNQHVTSRHFSFHFFDLPLSPNDTPVKPKREAD